MFGIEDIKNTLNISNATAKNMLLAVRDKGSDNVIKYKNIIKVKNLDLFFNELNEVEEMRKCKKKSKDLRKEVKYTGSISQSEVKEFANQLEQALSL